MAALQSLVTELRSLHAQRQALLAQIAPIDQRIAELKPAVIEIAPQFEPVPTEGGGCTWDLGGVLVCQPGPSLLSEISADAQPRLHEIAGRKFNRLFRPFYRPIPNFRLKAHEHLDRTPATKLITACEVASKPRVTVS